MPLKYQEVERAVEILSGRMAVEYQERYRRGPDRFEELLRDPLRALEFFLEGALVGPDAGRTRYGRIAVRALDDLVSDHGFEELMWRGDLSELLWKEFTTRCRSEGIRPNEKLNKDIIEGLVMLASGSPDYNLFIRISELLLIGNVFEAFLSLWSIRGIGSKAASSLLRDVVVVADLEPSVDRLELPYLFPMHAWMRRTIECLWLGENPRTDRGGNKDVPDWVLANHAVRRCLDHGFSPLEFNQGAWMFGAHVVRDGERLCTALKELARTRPLDGILSNSRSC